jgi:dipeptidyl aminopeptidase/acylaminoacyl peptidase
MSQRGTISISSEHEPVCRRFDEQRWLIDDVVRANGPEWDQGRLSHLVTIIGPEVAADVAGMRARMQKLADFGPTFEAGARRREARAVAAEQGGDLVTARENFFMAANYWASAQWTILRNDEKNLWLNGRKRECYGHYARLADHHVEAAWVPLAGGKALPGWLHLPPGYRGGKIPAVAAMSGMDGYKERVVAMYGDRFLSRGIAVLTIEGPGQYESAVLGIPVSVPAWLEAGRAMYEWLAGRPEIDPDRIGITGHSFGSFFSTIAAAGEARYRGCAVSGTCLEPGGHAIFEEASPTFKRRFMYMSGYTDEAAFDEFRKTLTWEPYAARIRAPYLCCTGEFDPLSPLEHTERLFDALDVPRTLVVYQGAGHGIGGVPSGNLGPTFTTLMADWMAARLAGKMLASERWLVDGAGQVHKQPL